MREHYRVAAPHSEEARRALEPPPLGDVGLIVWGWYCEIAERRPPGGFGPARIGWAEIEAWERRAGQRLRAHEARWVLEIERLWLEAMNPPPEPAATRGGRDRGPARRPPA